MSLIIGVFIEDLTDQFLSSRRDGKFDTLKDALMGEMKAKFVAFLEHARDKPSELKRNIPEEWKIVGSKAYEPGTCHVAVARVRTDGSWTTIKYVWQRMGQSWKSSLVDRVACNDASLQVAKHLLPSVKAEAAGAMHEIAKALQSFDIEKILSLVTEDVAAALAILHR